LHGFYRFVIGLCKKILIADVIGAQVDAVLGRANFSLLDSWQISEIFTRVTELDSTTAWIVSLAYTFQIYFDFAGYSDMAIGLGRIFGFDFKENFNYPFISASVQEFWRRWHISLSTWFKEYVYIPLGGNRKGSVRTTLNKLLVFFLTGFWHGANFTFIVWGLWHGLFQMLETWQIVPTKKKVVPPGRPYLYAARYGGGLRGVPGRYPLAGGRRAESHVPALGWRGGGKRRRLCAFLAPYARCFCVCAAAFHARCARDRAKGRRGGERGSVPLCFLRRGARAVCGFGALARGEQL
jgi:hypothetical protein